MNDLFNNNEPEAAGDRETFTVMAQSIRELSKEVRRFKNKQKSLNRKSKKKGKKKKKSRKNSNGIGDMIVGSIPGILATATPIVLKSMLDRNKGKGGGKNG
jgi:hypothetical protein